MQSVIKSEIEEDLAVQLEHERPDRERELAALYAEHQVKEELVVGPVVLQKSGPPAERLVRGAPVLTSPKLEINNEKLKQEKPPANNYDDTDTEENISETSTSEAIVDVRTTKTAEVTILTAKSETRTAKTLICSYCHKQFKAKRIDIEHIKIARDTTLEKLHDEQRQHVCETCSFRFATKGILQNLFKHRHAVNKRVKCEICYKKTYNLKDHIKIHSGEKPFSCPHCQQKYSCQSHLKIHLRTHTGEKPFSCPQCRYRCNSQYHLKLHIRTHTGEKPFSCPQCPHKCNSQYNLKIHIRTHTGEKPFSCPQCRYRCSQQSNMKTHISRKHSKV